MRGRVRFLPVLVALCLLAACTSNNNGSLPKATSSTVPGTCLREKRCLSARDVADLYRITPLHDRGIRGDGEAVAVIMESDVSDTDLSLFDSMMHITGAPALQRITVPLPAGADPVPATEDKTEATLDVETVRMVAPKARILLYIAPLRYFDLALKEVVADESNPERGARTVNYSAGGCSVGDTADSRKSDTEALDAAVKARPVINVFASSGDDGVYDCHDPNLDSFTWDVAVDFPSSSGNAISVGGTFLERTPSGGYLDEAAWENPLHNRGSGGGNDPLEPRPDWQTGSGRRQRVLRRPPPDSRRLGSLRRQAHLADRGRRQGEARGRHERGRRRSGPASVRCSRSSPRARA